MWSWEERDPLGGELKRALKNEGGRGLFIEKNPFHLRSNLDLDFLLGLYLSLNLIWLDLGLDVTF